MSVLRRYNPDTEQWEILQGGVQGLQGPPVALSKGTVATGAPGTNADFTVTGTPPNQKLNLTIPRGDVGPVGPTFGSDGSIIAAGRPDLPATMDTATQAAVSSASTGTLFRSTDGASVGAWMWMKRPSGWVVTDGNTGWREVAIIGMSKPVLIARVNDSLHITCANFSNTATGILSASLTTGYRLSKSFSDTTGTPIVADNGASLGKVTFWDGGGLQIKLGSAGSSRGFTLVQPGVIDPWPITLIGTPA